uniref:Tudor domain-containing protein n=1 Tax=Setaria digitata TaxID=48799 RepID=A0A915PSJ5_9BILA
MRRFGLEPIWTSEDTRNAILASLIPGTTAFTAFAVFANDRSVIDWWTHAKKPDWAPKDPVVYSVLDIATLSPLGYASYLVYKNGGGLQYSDTKFALGLYGLNMVFALTTIPLIKKKSFAYLFRNTVLLNATAIGAALAFYKNRWSTPASVRYLDWILCSSYLFDEQGKCIETLKINPKPELFLACTAGFRMGFDSPNKGSIVYRKADLEDAENDDVWDDSALIKMYDEMINRTYDSLGEQCTSAMKKKKLHKSPKIEWHVGDHCMAPFYDDQLWYPAVVKKLDLDDGKCEVLYDVYDELALVDIADLTKRLHARSAVSHAGRRHRRCSLAVRFGNFGDRRRHQQKQSQQCLRKRNTKRYCPDWTRVIQVERGIKRRKKNQTLPVFPDTDAFQKNVTFDLPRNVYLMRLLDHLRYQKPVENDEEGTSEGNTTQETFDMDEKELEINQMEMGTKLPSYMQSSKNQQHTSIPSLIPPPPVAFSSLSPPDDDEALASMLMSWYMTGYHTGYYQVKILAVARLMFLVLLLLCSCSQER